MIAITHPNKAIPHFFVSSLVIMVNRQGQSLRDRRME
jgi:hypothetical protein